MDSSDWTATALFSPSKARAQAAQAKDWAAVDAWLAKKYTPSKRPPLFERNEETLQALLELATINESADEQRALVDRVHKAALTSLRKALTANEGPEGEGKALSRELEGNVALDALARTAVVVGAADVRSATLASEVTELTAQRLDAERLLQRARDQLTALQAERRKANARLKELQGEGFRADEGLVEQTREWVRSSKQLRAKVGEYDERLSGLRGIAKPRVTVEDVLKQRETLEEQRARLRELEAKLEAFQNLPTDPRAARKKVEGAREELRALTQKRDELFEQLVDDG